MPAVRDHDRRQGDRLLSVRHADGTTSFPGDQAARSTRPGRRHHRDHSRRPGRSCLVADAPRLSLPGIAITAGKVLHPRLGRVRGPGCGVEALACGVGACVWARACVRWVPEVAGALCTGDAFPPALSRGGGLSSIGSVVRFLHFLARDPRAIPGFSRAQRGAYSWPDIPCRRSVSSHH